MPKRAAATPLIALDLDRSGDRPLYAQVYAQLRDAILGGRLGPGTRLPSTRLLSAEFGVSRNTVLAAYEQLLYEGYTEGRTGSGTRVSQVLPEELLATRGATGTAAGAATPARPPLSALARNLLTMPPRSGRSHVPFRPGVPEVAAFPFDQ